LIHIDMPNMSVFNILFAVAALTLANAAQFTMPSSTIAGGVTTGSPFDITWNDASGTVTILLKSGPASSLSTVSTIAS
jgi:hypothetical protein